MTNELTKLTKEGKLIITKDGGFTFYPSIFSFYLSNNVLCSCKNQHEVN